MKKFKDFSRSEKAMAITLILLLLAILLNWKRVSEGTVKGFKTFFSTPDNTENVSK